MSESYDRKYFAQMVPEEIREDNFQILFDGELFGFRDRNDEYDEDLIIGKVSYQKLPADWFTSTPDEELPMVQLN